jgi:hypothetical protein
MAQLAKEAERVELEKARLQKEVAELELSRQEKAGKLELESRRHQDNMAIKLTEIEARNGSNQDANYQQNLRIVARFDPATGSFY